MTKVVSVQLGHFIFFTFDSKLLRTQVKLTRSLWRLHNLKRQKCGGSIIRGCLISPWT